MARVWTLTGSAALVFTALLGAQHPGDPLEFPAPYGSRLPPVPPGEGGDILLTAPAEFCSDDGYEIRLRRYEPPPDYGLLNAVRGPAGPSACEWTIDGLREAPYDAVILRRDTEQIVAIADKRSVVRGGVIVMRLEWTQIELEGRITVNGLPPNIGLLYFSEPEGKHDWWEAPLADDGTYHARLDSTSGRLCMYLYKRARKHSIGSINIGCETFFPGLQRFDRDLRVPPGTIYVDVPPMGQPVSNDFTSLIVEVTYQPPRRRSPKRASTISFRASEGFQGEYLEGGYHDYEVRIQTVPHHRILAQTRITLSAEHPVGSVRLIIPPGSLGCDEGWFPAC